MLAVPRSHRQRVAKANGSFARVTRQAMRLRDKITVVERDATPPWIQTILCLPFAHIEPHPRDPTTHRAKCGNVWVVNENDLLDAIEEWPERKTRLSKPAREKWAAAVGRLDGSSSLSP